MRSCFLKRLAAYLLVLTLAVSLLPAAALAAEVPGEESPAAEENAPGADAPDGEERAEAVPGELPEDAPERGSEEIPEEAPEDAPEEIPEPENAAEAEENAVSQEAETEEGVSLLSGSDAAVPPDWKTDESQLLELDGAVVVTPGSYNRTYFTFVPEKTGYYTITAAPTDGAKANASRPYLCVWDMKYAWDGSYYSCTFYAETGVTQYMMLYPDDSYAYSVQISEYQTDPLTVGSVVSLEQLNPDNSIYETTRCFCFTPETAGKYTVTLTNADPASSRLSEMTVWEPEKWRWASNHSQTFQLTAQDTKYIQVILRQDCTIQVTEDLSESVNEISIQQGEAELVDSFTLRIPVEIAVPLKTNFWSAVQYEAASPDGTRTESGTVPSVNSASAVNERMSVVVDLPVKPDMNYTYYFFAVDQTDVLCTYKGEERTYQAGPSSAVEVTVLSPAKGTAAPGSSRQYFSFTPAESGMYTAENSIAGTLRYLKDGLWQVLERDKPVYVQAGVPLYMYVGVYPEKEYQYELHVYAQSGSVSEPSILSVKASGGNNSFFGTFSAAVTVPLGCNFRMGVHYTFTYPGGTWKGTAYGTKEENCSREYYAASVTITDFLPGAECIYEVFVEYEAGGKTNLYEDGVKRSFTTAPFTGTVLELDQAQTFTDPAQDLYCFIPPEDGDYTISAGQAVTANSSSISSSILQYVKYEGDNREVRFTVYDSDYSIKMKEGIPCYFYYRMGLSGCTMKVTKGTYQTVQTHAVEQSAVTQQDVFRAGVLVDVSVPRRTNYEVGVELMPEGRKVSAREFLGTDSEHPAVTVWLETLPGKTYHFRAYLKMNGTTVYGEEMTYTSAGSDSAEIVSFDTDWVVKRGEEDVCWANDRIFKFVPAIDGRYTVTVGGTGAAALALEEDQVWPERESFTERKSQTVELKAGVPLYVWYSLGSSLSNGTLHVSPTLTLESAAGRITASLPTNQPGRYFFTAYDASGRFLGCRIREKPGTAMETLSADLTVDQASLVKAFVGDPDTGRPLRACFAEALSQAG